MLATKYQYHGRIVEVLPQSDQSILIEIDGIYIRVPKNREIKKRYPKLKLVK